MDLRGFLERVTRGVWVRSWRFRRVSEGFQRCCMVAEAFQRISRGFQGHIRGLSKLRKPIGDSKLVFSISGGLKGFT